MCSSSSSSSPSGVRVPLEPAHTDKTATTSSSRLAVVLPRSSSSSSSRCLSSRFASSTRMASLPAVIFLVISSCGSTTRAWGARTLLHRQSLSLPLQQPQQPQQQLLPTLSCLQWVHHQPCLGSSSSLCMVSMSGDPTTSSSSMSSSSVMEPPTTATAATRDQNDLAVVDWDWRAVAKAVFETDTRPIILFDGICNFCNAGVNMCLDLDPTGKFRYASLQSTTGKSLLLRSGRKPNDISSIVLCTADGKAYVHSDAVLRIGKELQGLPWPLRVAASASIRYMPRRLRDGAYKIVAANRYRFGESAAAETCRLDLDGSLQERFVSEYTTTSTGTTTALPASASMTSSSCTKNKNQSK